MNKYYKLIHYNGEEAGPLQLKNISGVDAGFSMVLGGNGTVPSYTPDLEYSLDGTTWTVYDFTNLPTITVPAGGQIYLRGTNTTGFNGNNNYYWHFHMDQDYDIIGNMLSVIDYTNLNTITSVSTLGSLVGFFDGETHLIHAHQSNYGSTINSIGRYGMCFVFRNCTNLLTPPDLSTWKVTTATQNLLESMFDGCSSLMYCPDLSTFTSVQSEGFIRMFRNCTSIKNGVDFTNITTAGSAGSPFMQTFYGCTSLVTPAKIGKVNFQTPYRVFQEMYQGCTSLKTGMDIRNVTFSKTDSGGMDRMYYGCSSLKTAYVAPSYLQDMNNWLNGVPGNGTLYIPYGYSLPAGTSGFPWSNTNSWTVVYY